MKTLCLGVGEDVGDVDLDHISEDMEPALLRKDPGEEVGDGGDLIGMTSHIIFINHLTISHYK